MRYTEQLKVWYKANKGPLIALFVAGAVVGFVIGAVSL